MKALITIGTALCFVLAISAAQVQEAAEAQQAVNQKQAQKEKSAKARFEKAAQAICGGENAAYELTSITIDCFTKRGFLTQKVKL
jgi:hypothetical protein